MAALSNGTTLGRVFYLGPLISSFDRVSIAPLLVPLAIDFHASLALVANAATLYYFLYGITQPVYGILSDRFGRVPLIAWSLFAVMVGSVFSAVAPSVLWLIIARAATGAAMAAVIPASLVYIADSYPYLVRQRAIVEVSAATGVGTTLGILGSGILATYVSWRVPFALTAIACGCLALAMRRLAEPNRAASAGVAAQLRKVWKAPWVRVVIALALADGAVFQGLTTYFAPALQSRGVTAAMAGLVVAGYGLATLIGSRLVRRAGGPSGPMLIAIGSVMLAVGYLLAAAIAQTAGILAASLLAGAAYAFIHSSLQTWATEVVPEARGTATALFVTTLFVGAAVAAGLAAGPADMHAYPAIFLVGAAVSIVLGVAGAATMRRYQRTLPGPPLRLAQS